MKFLEKFYHTYLNYKRSDLDVLMSVKFKVMSRDVPICNILAICREVLNNENREVLHLGKYFISRFVAIFYKMEASKKIKYFS